MNQILVTGNINKNNSSDDSNKDNRNNVLNQENSMPIENIKTTSTNENSQKINSGYQKTEENTFFENDLTYNESADINYSEQQLEDNSFLSNSVDNSDDFSKELNFSSSLDLNQSSQQGYGSSYDVDQSSQQSYNEGFKLNDNSQQQYANFNYEETSNQYGYNNYGNKMEVNSIVKIFAIALIVFGCAALGIGSSSALKLAKEKENQKIPEVSVTRKGNVLSLNVKSEIPLRSVAYAWNDDNYLISTASQKNEYTADINVIDGENNKLNIFVIDMSNKKTNYKEKYSKAPDTIEPEILISNEDPKIKITVKDDTAIDHVTYKYGDNEEKTEYANSENPKVLEIYIDNIETKQATLLVEAVDTAQNHAEKSQEVKGTTKPKIEIKPVSADDPSILQIAITCEDNLQKIVIYLGDKRYSTPDNISIDKKQFIQKVKVEKGMKIKVNAYNVSDQMAEEEIICNY